MTSKQKPQKQEPKMPQIPSLNPSGLNGSRCRGRAASNRHFAARLVEAARAA